MSNVVSSVVEGSCMRRVTSASVWVVLRDVKPIGLMRVMGGLVREMQNSEEVEGIRVASEDVSDEWVSLFVIGV